MGTRLQHTNLRLHSKQQWQNRKNIVYFINARLTVPYAELTDFTTNERTIVERQQKKHKSTGRNFCVFCHYYNSEFSLISTISATN